MFEAMSSKIYKHESNVLKKNLNYGKKISQKWRGHHIEARSIPPVHINPNQMPQAVFAQFEVKSNLNRFDNQNRFHSKDSGIESDHSPKKTLFPAEPNLGQ